MSQSNEAESNRWWDFYAVRYAMGTVVGAMIFFFLCQVNPVLKPLLFGAETGSLDAAKLLMLAGYGLAFCYIASAPILVFHSGRYRLEVGQPRKINWFKLALILVPPLFLTIIILIIASPKNDSLFFYVPVCYVAMLLFWTQYLIIGRAIFKSDELFSFYKKLSKKRSTDTGGIVNSYKHLREHGNAFAIVQLEIFLAVLLYAVGSLWTPEKLLPSNGHTFVLPYLCVIFIWTLPAALTWQVGTLFERRFMDSVEV